MKSVRSRIDIRAAGTVSAPTIARKSDISELERLDPANANKCVSALNKFYRKANTLGGEGGAEPIRNTVGAITVDIIPRTRILSKNQSWHGG